MLAKATLLLALLLVSNCNNSTRQISNHDLQQKRWTLTAMQGVPQVQSPVWVEFDSTSRRFNGHGGCNKLSGDYAMMNNHITFNEVVSTRMACVDSMSNERESMLLQLLADHVYMVDVEGAKLQLIDSGKVILQFE